MVQITPDMSGVTLTGVDLSGRDLSGVNLSEAHLTDVNLSEAHLENANLHHATLVRCDLSEANLTGAHMRGVDGSYVNFTYARMGNMNISYVDFTDCNFHHVDMPLAHVTDGIFARTSLYGVDMRGTCIRNMLFDSCDFVYSSLWQTTILQSIFSGSNFQGAHMDGCVLMRNDFRGAVGFEQSHAIISSILFAAAVEPWQVKVAGFVQLQPMLCWVEIAHALGREEAAWAQGILSQWPDLNEHMQRLVDGGLWDTTEKGEQDV